MTVPDDYNVVFVPFPGTIRSCVRIDKNGYPTVYVNIYLSPKARKKALAHELKHIARDDFYNSNPIQQIEGASCPDREDNT